MKKIVTSMLLLFVCTAASYAFDNIYFVGGSAGWSTQPTTEFTTSDGETYTYEEVISSTIYFCLADGQTAAADDWDDFNANFRLSTGVNNDPISVGTPKTVNQRVDASLMFTGTGKKYCFTYVKSTGLLTITEVVKDFVVTFINDGDWDKVYAYTWTGEDPSKTEFDGAWPGDDACLEKSLTTQKFNGVDHYVYTYTYTGVTAPENIIFHNNSGAQTADLKFVDGAEYSFSLAPVYAVVGSVSALFAKDWDAAGTTDWMESDGAGNYVWSKENVTLAKDAGIELKVIKKDYKEASSASAWYGDGTPGDPNVIVSPSAAGVYTVTVQLNSSNVASATTVLTKEAIGIGATGWGTWYTNNILDFSGMSFSAYTATCDGSKVTLAKVDDVDAGTAFVLKGDEGTYYVPFKGSSSTDKGALKFYDSYKVNDGGVDYYVYGLVVRGGTAQFAQVNDGEEVGGHVILQVAKSSSARAALDVVFADETTGISAIENAANAGVYYNLQGVRVAQPTKGLYIVNGKKVIMK
ncbi:MAG: starch-binding protein [Prevotella sp.]|nr:starch-binding protein [Prevotella sp.]